MPARGMIRVAYDHQIFAGQRHGGISRYFVKLVQRVGAMSDFDACIIAPLHVSELLGGAVPYVFGTKVPRVPRTGRLLDGIDALLVRAMLRARPRQLLHETYYRAATLAPRGVPLVVTVYDMIHERFPESQPDASRLTDRKRRAVQRAALVICISDHTRHDLLERIPVAQDRVVTVHLGVDPPIARPQVFATEGRSILLYVGERGGYKNFFGLLNAYAASSQLRASCRVIAFGGGPLTAAEVAACLSLGLVIGDDVTQTGGDDSLLARHYASALALVYPSMYEGFGLPPLEAMRFGCPVACARAGAIPEIAGDAAAYFEPEHVDSIQDTLERVAASSELRRDLIARGSARSARFSWDQCAERTASLYREVARRPVSPGVARGSTVG